MNDPVLVTLYVRAGLAVALILGGILAVFFGYRVYQDKVSDGRSRMILQSPGLKVTAHAAGAVVMATAVAWGALGVRVSPNFRTSPKMTEVYSFQTPTGNVQAPAIAGVRWTRGLTAVSWDDKSLVATFSEALAHQKQGPATISGQPATVDLRSVKAVKRADGDFVLSTMLNSATASAIVEFEPRLLMKEQSQRVVFQPTTASVVSRTPP